MKTWYLIDAFNLIFRSYYGMPELITDSGVPTGAIHGWVKTIWALQDQAPERPMICFFDLGGSHKRSELHADYKANRKAPPPDLLTQVPYILELTQAMGIACQQIEGVEADDLLASASHHIANQRDRSLIVSADKDLAQLLSDKVHQLLPPPTANPKLGWRLLTPEKVVEKFGVSVDQIVDYLALLGDSSDNIPGVAGVGPKTATKWLTTYGSLERILEVAPEIKPTRFQSVLVESRELLKRNQALIELKPLEDVPVPGVIAPDPEKLFSLLEELEMSRTLNQARQRFATAH